MSDREYPAGPVLGVAGVMFQDDSVLLARRAAEPALGEWSLPGGVVELGESMVEALERELMEEASVRIRVEGLVHLAERVIRDEDQRIRFHYVIADYWGWITSGSPEAATDVSEVCLLPVDRLHRLPLHQGIRRVIQEARVMRRRVS